MVAVSTVRQFAGGRRNRLEVEHQRDFAGGLNLKDDPYNLGKNESFDLQNVDIDRRGGFGVRRGMRPFINVETGFGGGATQAADSGYTYVDPTNVRHILIARAGNVKRWDGAAWQNVFSAAAVTGRTAFTEMNDALYFRTPASTQVQKWTGSGLSTALTTVFGNFNDDLTAPNAGNFPTCTDLVSHKEVMWAANTTEGGVFYKSRVRWSHPGQPEDWRTNDFIDIDPDDENGVIRALVPFGDRLLVFKDKAIYAIHGYPPAGFSVENLTKQLGTPSTWSVVSTEEFVYFWDVDKGAWRYDGSKFEWVFEPLYRLIDDEKINVAFSFQAIVEYHRDRLWVSVPMVAPPYDGQFISLVFQPNAGKNGAWTLHTRTLFGWWIHRGSEGGDEHLIGGLFDATPNGLVYELDVENLYQDELLPAGADNRFIPAWYTTRWFDADNAAEKKRWKRPVLVMRGGQNQTTVGEVLADYDPTKVVKTFNLITSLPSETIKRAYLELTAGDEEAFTENVINPTGTILLGIDIDPNVITGPFQALMAKWNTFGADERSFLFQISDTGFLRLLTSSNGTAGTIILATCSAVLPDANRRTVWVEFNPNDGGGNRVTKFYTSNTLSGTKTQLGSTITVAGTTSIFTSNVATQIGLHSIDGQEEFLGKVYTAEIRDNGGLTGTILAQPNFVVQEPGTLLFTDDFGVTWQLDSGAAIVDDSIVVSDEGIWDTDSWDTMIWAREITLGGERSEILRGPPLGGGVARALRFKNTVQGQDWRIHGLTMKYIPKRIRN